MYMSLNTSGQGELRGKKNNDGCPLSTDLTKYYRQQTVRDFFLVLNMQRVLFACNTQYLQKPMTGSGSTRVA